MKGLRHENKYFISKAGYYMLRTRLKTALNLDKHADLSDNLYKIRSLYFDDYFKSGYFDKIDGVYKREKFRIRFYNMNDSFIRLESKQKFGNITRKLNATLTRDEVDSILKGDIAFLYDKDDDLLKRFYIKCRTLNLKPSVIVDYDREAYTFEDVRVTFDHDLHSGNYNFEIFNPNIPTIPVFPPDRVIIEVKYDERLPDIIKQLLRPVSAVSSAISKYQLCKQFQ